MHLNPPSRGRRSSIPAAIAVQKRHRLLLVISAATIVGLSKSDLTLAQGLTLAPETAPAAPPVRMPASPPQVQPMRSDHPVWVNPSTGNDAKADGSEQAPFRTLTRALEAARPNTVIQLAAGTYNTNTGEVFPIVLKSGVTVQGHPGDLGHGIVIRGGGSYSSATAGSQNVTVVGTNQATLTGVTITNPSVRGHGLWVETGSPTIGDNTFISNSNTGLVAAGSSAPIIQNNLFVLNRVNGLMVTGYAQPQVQNNVFQRTGAGVTIGENAVPQIINNRISQNRDGIIVQDNAHPILRSNTIEDSQRNGLVVIAQAQPNLGTAKDPGNNTFANNHQHDINALTTSQTLPAFGNQLNPNQLVGKIDLTGNAPLVSVATVASAADRLPATQIARFAPTSQTASPRPAPPSRSAPSSSTPSSSAPSSPTQSNPSTPITQPPPLISSLPPTSPPQPQPAQRPTPQTVLAATATTPTRTENRINHRQTQPSDQHRTTAPSTAVSMTSRPPRSTSTARNTARTSPAQTSTAQTNTAQTNPSENNRPASLAAIELNVPPPERSAPATSTRATSAIPHTSAILRAVSVRPAAAPAAPSTPQAIPITVPPPASTVQSVQPMAPQLANVIVTAAASLPRRSFAGTNAAIPALGGTPIPIPVPPPARPATATSAAPGSVSLLPVPSAEIPVGNTDGLARVNVAGGLGGNLLLASRPENLRYRVVVAANDEQVQTLVHSLIPDAFVTALNGESVMQIGAFSSRDNAQEAIELLSRNGLQGIIQPME